MDHLHQLSKHLAPMVNYHHESERQSQISCSCYVVLQSAKITLTQAANLLPYIALLTV